MRIITWNINGLAPTLKNVKLRYGSLQQFFDHLGADVVCLQETKLSSAAVTRDLACIPGWESFWSSSRVKLGYSGCATFVRLQYAACAAVTDFTFDADEALRSEGRLVLTDHSDFVIANIYAPNSGDRPERARLPFKLAWYAALQEELASWAGRGRRVVLVGDFNIPRESRDVHPGMEWKGLYSDEELSLMGQLATRYIDTWRHLHRDTTDVYTVWSEKTSARLVNRGLRIDYALCSPALLDQVTGCEVLLDLPPVRSCLSCPQVSAPSF